MIRWVIIVGLSLAAIGTLGVYVASYRAGSRGVEQQPIAVEDAILVRHGVVYFVFVDEESGPSAPNPGNWSFAGFRRQVLYAPQDREFGGLHLGPDASNLLKVVEIVGFPLWWLVVAGAAYPVLAFIRGPLRRYRRRRRNLCLHCGYNLTGNVSGVCPECGRAL